MSKKNKNKFKKHFQAKILQEVNSEANKTAIKPIASINNSKRAEIKTNNNVAALEVQNLPLIKADLIKTGIVVALLAAIILTLGILDGKYHILLKFGDILFKTFNIN